MVRDWSSALSSRWVWVTTPCSSVWPKTMLNWQPNASLARVTSSAGTNEAPDMMLCRLRVSRFSRSGWLSNALSMVGTTSVIVPR